MKSVRLAPASRGSGARLNRNVGVSRMGQQAAVNQLSSETGLKTVYTNPPKEVARGSIDLHELISTSVCEVAGTAWSCATHYRRAVGADPHQALTLR